jgi:hypothetical protein
MKLSAVKGGPSSAAALHLSASTTRDWRRETGDLVFLIIFYKAECPCQRWAAYRSD